MVDFQDYNRNEEYNYWSNNQIISGNESTLLISLIFLELRNFELYEPQNELFVEISKHRKMPKIGINTEDSKKHLGFFDNLGRILTFDN